MIANSTYDIMISYQKCTLHITLISPTFLNYDQLFQPGIGGIRNREQEKKVDRRDGQTDRIIGKLNVHSTSNHKLAHGIGTLNSALLYCLLLFLYWLESTLLSVECSMMEKYTITYSQQRHSSV